MKATIYIKGQINGNSHLKCALNGYESSKDIMFNGIALHYNTKKEAIKAIRDAYNTLIADEPQRKNKIGGIRVNKDRTQLYYDASQATIE